MSDGLIQATSQGIKGTYKDGTIKIELTIEPSEAANAFELFGVPGAPVVIGRLTQEAAQAALQQSAAKGAQAPVKHEQEAVKQEEMKGGELAKWAGILANDALFGTWALVYYSNVWKSVTTDLGGQSQSAYADLTAEFIRRFCQVESRRDLDHNRQAGLTFREEIMKPFHQWREEQ